MTKQQLSYRMPAEWTPHSATQLHWPSNRETWPGERLQRVEQVYLDIIEALHPYEEIVLLVNPGVNLNDVSKLMETRLIDLNRIHLYSVPINDVWARDCGPIFVQNLKDPEDFLITNWEYNAWGEKYPPFDDDNRLPEWFSKSFDLPLISTGMVLEGGSIETNGRGVLLTTESVLLNKNRNPKLSKSDIESHLKHYLGMEKIIWLKRGLQGDDTDGHIDDLSRFLNRNTILTMLSDDPDDVNYAILKENYEILKGAVDQHGQPLHIVTLPLPQTKIKGTTVDGSEYVPASYANFYVANGVVLVPLYDERHDDEALELFREFYPGRDVVGIECADLVWGQGSIHCITQQLYGISF
ncbi:agmatine deiminase family protein [Rhodohalobacter halophilus]|uniref:agmatine deiminase family protein n=1 Tax=Rhodohalobacter halophilus TaxID=1812810 RepID=UPI00083F8A5C|nr:agmatine deiminase family protein [Rhodohalobacter halophilus]